MESSAASVSEMLGCWCRMAPLPVRAVAPLDERGWNALLAAAEWEGVTGLIHRTLSRDPDGRRAPGEVRLALSRAALAQAAAHAWEEPIL